MQFSKSRSQGFPSPSESNILITAESAQAHHAIAAMLDALDFSDAQAVDAVHLRLRTHAPALFPANFFLDGHGCALAALLLLAGAVQRQQTTQWIKPDRDEARRTLVARLTRIGQEALLQSRERSDGENAFSKYLAQADRDCLAGHLYRERADAHLKPEGFDPTSQDARAPADGDRGKAAEIARTDADARSEQDRYRQAAVDYALAAEAYAGGDPTRDPVAYAAGDPGLAAEAWLCAARAASRAGQPLQALAAFEKSALENERAGRHGLAGDAWRNIADIFSKHGGPENAKQAFENAGAAYLRAAEGGPTMLQSASDALGDSRRLNCRPAVGYLMAAEALRAAGQDGRAKDAFLKAAETFMEEKLTAEALNAYVEAERFPEAIAICSATASSHLEAGERLAAADALCQLGFVLGLAGQPFDKEATAFRDAARLYAEEGAFESAAEACLEANDLEQAAQFYKLAQRFELAGFAFEEMEMFALAAPLYTLAAERATDPEDRKWLKGRAQQMAERANVQSD
ncbi:soluble NSF attachment family protein [Pandoraea sputorum]|uniref:Uncharacterized protein n=1 Tax=Pandoraea sputorum TaxID=93222 RepID=A0A5E5BK42_9BURK|nr:hypothetical protein [Pandoraea sputorum]VVE85718.1 hypothetical protein PSP31121_05381 [Pandoraea sputorum]